MTVKHYLIAIFTGSVFAWIAWTQVLLQIDPVLAGRIAIIVFYLTLFTAIFGTLIFLLTLTRYFASKKWSTKPLLITSIRQSMVLSIIFILSLFLSSKDQLSFFSFLLIMVFIGGIEYIFLAKINKPIE